MSGTWRRNMAMKMFNGVWPHVEESVIWLGGENEEENVCRESSNGEESAKREGGGWRRLFRLA